MAIRKNVLVFMGGSLQKVDLDDKHRVVSGGAAAGAPPAVTARAEMIVFLKGKGIKFPGNISNDALERMVQENTEPEPPAVTATGGTGNQEVI